MLEHLCHQNITSLSLMHWLKLCLTLGIASSVANALSLTHGLGATLSWSSVTQCDGQGTIGTDIQWQYSGNDQIGSTLTISATGTGSSFPEIAEGEHWKADSVCYQAIRTIELGTLTSIGARAFTNIPLVSTINGGSVTTIGEYAFEGSGVLGTSLALPKLTSIGTGAFKNVRLMVGLRFRDGVTIGDYAFEGSSLESFDISAGKATLGKGVLKDCTSLTTFKGGSNLATVPESFFERCVSLSADSTHFVVTTSMSEVGARAFFGCSSMSLDILTAQGQSFVVGESAFERCGVTGVDFSNAGSLTIGKAAFKDCESLTYFSGGDIPAFPESCLEGCTSLWRFSLSGPMVEVRNRAFFGCSSLSTNFGTAEMTTLLGESAFEGSGVTELILTTHAKTFKIGASAFRNCVDLRKVTWSPTYDTLADSIFEGSGLRSIEIPATVTTFGEACFRNCKSLSTVIYNGLAEAPSSVFSGCDGLMSVTVPNDYPYNEFGGYRVKEESGLSLGAKIGIGVGVAAFVIIVIIVVVVVLFVTGTIGGGKRDAEPVEA